MIDQQLPPTVCFVLFCLVLITLLPLDHVHSQPTRIAITCDDTFILYHNGNNVLSGDQWSIFYNITLNLTQGDILVVEGGNSNWKGSLFVEFQDLWQNNTDLSTGVGPWKCTFFGNVSMFGYPFQLPTRSNFTEWKKGVVANDFNYPSLNRITTSWIWPEGTSEYDGHERVLCGISISHTCYGISSDDVKTCSGNGQCIAKDTCQCSDGYSGIDCSVIDICTSPLFNNTLICAGNSVKMGETIVEKVTSAYLNSKNVVFSSSTKTLISLPSNMQKYLIWVDPTLSYETIKLVSLISSSSQETILSSVATMAMVKETTNQRIPITNLTTPITFSFNQLSTTTSNISSLNLTCVYYDEATKEWKSDGVTTEISSFKSQLVSSGNWTIDFSVNCNTKHLTSFAVVDINLKKATTTTERTNSLQDNTVVIAAVVSSVAGCCLLVSVIALVIAVSFVFIRMNNKKKNSLSN